MATDQPTDDDDGATWDYTRWLPTMAGMADSNRERVTEANDHLDQGRAVVLDYDHEHDADSTILYVDPDTDRLLYSPVVDGRRYVYAYGRNARSERKTTTTLTGMADARHAVDVTDTRLSTTGQTVDRRIDAVIDPDYPDD